MGARTSGGYRVARPSSTSGSGRTRALIFSLPLTQANSQPQRISAVV